MAQRIQHYDVGDIWVAQATFTVSGTPTDPTSIIVRQQDAAGVETVLFTGATAALNASSTPVAKTGTGVYKLNPGVSLTASGYWFVKFEGTAGVVATEQQQAIVDPDEFTSDAGVATYALVGLSETKDWLKHQNIDTTDDLSLVRVINDISARFAEEAEREFKVFGTNPQTRQFSVNDYTRCVEVGDLATLSTASNPITVTGPDWTTTVYTFQSTDVRALPLVRRTWDPITKLEISINKGFLVPGMTVNVTGNWGFPAVPGNVRQAVLDAVVSTMDRSVENYQEDLALGAATGSSTTLLLSLPPSAMEVAQSYSYEYVG